MRSLPAGTPVTERDAGRRSRPEQSVCAPAALLLAAALAAGACARQPSAWRAPAGGPPPDVVLVTIDTLRADHLASYGYGAIQTPNIDRLAAEGARFANAASAVPFTLPAHSSIMTGTYPPWHGVRENVGYRLDDKVPTLAELLRAQGYATAGFVSAFVLDSRWGIGRGFDRYMDDFDLGEMQGRNMGSVQRPGAETVAAALAWLDRERPPDRPFFLWLHLFEPHDPYTPPEPYRSRYVGRPYDGEVAYADELFGRFRDGLRERGLLERTLLVLTGDHGEGLGDHGESFHGYFVYDSTTHVPLLMRPPGGLPAGRVVEPPVSHVDIVPTVLDALGVPPPEDLQGESLLPLLEAGEEDPPPPRRYPVYSESLYPLLHYGWAPLRALREGPYKYIRAPREELYELPADPQESDNLAPELTATTLQLSRRLDAALQEIEFEGEREQAAADLDEAALRQLRALGYVAGRGATAADAGGAGAELNGRADPKDKIRLHQLIMAAQSDIGRGDEEAAERRLRRVLELDPQILDANQMLGNILAERGQFAAAAEHYRAALAIDPEHEASLYGLARAYERLGRLDDALVGYRRLLEINPTDSKAASAAADILVERGRLADATALVRAAAQQDNAPAIVLNKLGELLVLQERPAEAERWFRAAVERNEELAQAWFNLAVLHEERGQVPRAMELYETALRHQPRHYQALFNLGRLAGTLGDTDRQLQLYQQAIEANPDFVRGYYLLALRLMETGGDLERAERLVRQGLDRDPDHRAGPLGYYVLADILNRQGRRQEAQEAARRGKQLEGS